MTIIPLSPPSFPENRWLDNHTHLGSVNYLKKLNKDYEVRLNASYLNDYQRQFGNTNTIFFTPADTVSITENKYNRLFFSELEFNLTVQKNTKRKFFKNLMTAKGYADRQHGLITGNNGRISQDAKNPYYSITNTLRDYIRLGNNLGTINSYIAISNTPQSLTVAPGQFFDLLNKGTPFRELRQTLSVYSFSTHNTIELTKKIKYFTMTTQLGIQLEKKKLNSDIKFLNEFQKTSLDSIFINNLDRFKLKLYGLLKTQYRKEGLSINLDIPTSYYLFNTQDIVLNKKDQLSRFTPEPRLSIRYEANSYWTASGSLDLRKQFGEIEDIHYGYILKNYRSIERRNIPIQDNTTLGIHLGVSYRNPLTGLFGNISYIHSKTNKNLIYNSIVASNGSLQLLALQQRNSAHIQNLNLHLGKYFHEIKTSTNLGINYSDMEGQQLINGILEGVSNQSIMPFFKLNTNLDERMDFEYAYKISGFQTIVSENKKPFNTQQQHQLNLNFYPVKNGYIGIQNEYYSNNFSTSNRQNFFTDVLLRHTIAKRKIDLEAHWTNIWNTSLLTTASVSSFSYITSTYQLRPSQMMLKVRFSF
jgi:hypothetical protein